MKATFGLGCYWCSEDVFMKVKGVKSTIVTCEELLTLFWDSHDPTTLNRQGPDEGTQYWSSVFFHSKDQEKAAKVMKEKLWNSTKFGNKKIVTEIVPTSKFWKA